LKPLISVVLCTYNRKDILKKSLEALLNQSLPSDKYELLVVDDGSEDGTGELIKNTFSSSNLHYLYKENGGLCSARNFGLEHARGDYIFFTDDDIIADPNLLEEHLKRHEKQDKLVVRGRVNHFSGEVPSKPGFTMADISFNFFWTSNVSVKKKYLDEAGRFDESFREYGWEDIELGLRLRKLGIRSVYHRKAIGYHFKKKLTFEDVPKVLRQSEAKGRSAVIFLDKTPAWRARLTTGIFFPRMQINLLLFSNSLVKDFFRKYLTSVSNKVPLSSFQLFCLRQLALVTYYETITKELAKKVNSSSIVDNDTQKKF